ncbi:hypothetical protein LT679_14960 [Mucilaginibacter roseus]|uniref:Uncharacterized protein n=1 Tax=Mucilaginibacter roseus TaxID=1528868 RepID=A0ABS8U480_9SPHI|nr:hypothetical protein [Mucilaginibacter roseus]MCD8741913.1 hypothetical protein [Mucilaginibacter roseus]
MRLSIKHLTQLALLIVLFVICSSVNAQVRTAKKINLKLKASNQYAVFDSILNTANVRFTQPKGFREIPALDNEDFTFDYAMDIPGQDFEVWYQVRSQKQNWASYDRFKTDEQLKLANPDSIYKDIAQAHAIAFTGQRNSFVRVLPSAALKRYNADAGRSYILTLEDMPETRHYQYALLIALQKYHTGTILMVCFTNQKDPEFYKNVERAGSSLKFKAVAQNVNKLAD